MSTSTPQQLWIAALGELQVRLARPVFDTFLKDTIALHAEGSCLVVGTESPFVAEYLEKRLSGAIEHTVEGLAHRPLEVRFQVTSDGAPTDRDGHAAAEAQAPAANEVAPTQPSAPASAPLNGRYSFDSFVVGSSNELANAAAVAAAASPGLKYNPVFLYSGVGLGKTHLLHAVGHQMAGNGMRVLYVSSDQFTTEFVGSIREGRAQQFRANYQGADALLIDDVQLLSGKERTQEGLFNIFNELHSRNRQIVIAADRPPKALTTLEDRLRSRFEWGLIADIQPPDVETRLAILRNKVKSMGVEIPEEVMTFLANRIRTNIRRLEGALIRVASYAHLTGKELTNDVVENLLREILQEEGRHTITIEFIQKKVAEKYDIRMADMTSKRRPENIAFPRQIAMFLSRQLTEHSLSAIGEAFGGRDHGTVLHACRLVKDRCEIDANVRQTVSYLEKQLLR